MAVALESVVKQLTDSGIITQGQLENFIPPKADPKSVEELVAELVKNNHLTKFQAVQVAAGKAKSLILGEYTIVDRIGAGGMGQVFKALHRRMERTVAIKMLPPAMTKDAAALARFQREVVAAAKLHHTNIVTAHDAGQAGTAHFLVMEYVAGKDLSAAVKKDGPFPVSQAVNYILQAARGLEYAHKKGVVHRDIKPANLLLDTEGTVKILDMGLARIESDGNVAAQAELTGTGAVMGTVDYMAPEQGMSTKHADARADIYSLGCSLYYLLVGKAVYGGETVAAKLIAHHNNPIPDLRAECPAVSQQLEAVFKKMVAKRLEERYQTMTEVIADLERLGGNSGTVSDPLGGTAAFDPSALAALKSIDVSRTTAKTTATKRAAPKKPGGGKRPPWKNAKVLIGAGAAGFLFLLLGVILIVRDKDGKEVARIDAPDGTKVTLPAGGSVQVRQSGATATPKSTTAPPADQYALDFSSQTAPGVARVECPHPINPLEPFTAEMFATLRSGTHDKNQCLLLLKGFVLKQTGLNLDWSGKRETNATYNRITASNFELNRRTHIAGVSTGREIRLFLDGRLIGSTPLVGDFSLSLSKLILGGHDFDLSNWIPFDGTMDEFRLSSTARYDKDFEPPSQFTADKDTIALYRFDEGTGDVLHDASGHGHDGKITGAKWVRADGSSVPQTTRGDFALEFAGPSIVTVPGIAWGRLPEYTLEAYARSDSAAGFVIDRYRNTALNRFGGRWQFTATYAGEEVPEYARDTATSASTGWDHLAGVVRNNVMHLYVNGKRTQSTPLRKELEASFGDKLEFGRALTGRIRMIRISKVARYDKDFTPHAQFEPDADTLALYRFDEGTGDVLHDSSGNGHDGKIVGAKWVRADGSSTNAATAPPHAVAPFDAAQAKAHQAIWAKHLGIEVETTNSVGQKMVLIPPGEFMMGSSDADIELALKMADALKVTTPSKDRILKAERPQHLVTITKPFLIGATEVTVGEFKKFAVATGYKTEAEVKGNSSPNYLSPGFATTDDFPAAAITWNDAQAFCKWISTKEKTNYRLPTEAEREYACRAGTTTQFSFGESVQLFDQYGWCDRNSDGKLRPVALKQPDPFGLFDMHGNLAEWCSDFYDEAWYRSSPQHDPKGPPTGTEHTMRGGNWFIFATNARSAFRFSYKPETIGTHYGFRIVREFVAPATTASVTPQPAVPTASSAKLFMHDPAFPQWVKDVQAMPAEQQIKAVSKKLMELNPGFDGKLTEAESTAPPVLQKGALISLGFDCSSVTDISPVRALSGLTALNCSGTATTPGKLSDLSPLQDIPLTTFYCPYTDVSDLSPLRAMVLDNLSIHHTNVSDVTVLRGKPIKFLNLGATKISDVSPLRQMPLIKLWTSGLNLVDTGPLSDLKELQILNVRGTNVTSASVAALQKALPNCKIEWDDPSKPPVSTNPVATSQQPTTWTMRKVAEWVIQQGGTLWIGGNKNIAKLEDLPPGEIRRIDLVTFADAPHLGDEDAALMAQWPAVSGIALWNTKITDAGLRKLASFPSFGSFSVQGEAITGEGFDAFQGKPMGAFVIQSSKLSSAGWQAVAQLGPTQQWWLNFSNLDDDSCQAITRRHSEIEQFHAAGTRITDRSVLALADHKQLKTLYLANTGVTDDGLAALERCASLSSLTIQGTKVTPAAVAALQKALPNCKIEWDDPAKPTTPAPAPSGKK